MVLYQKSPTVGSDGAVPLDVERTPPPIILPEVLINPLDKILPPVTLPLALTTPETYSPVVAKTTTLLVPPIDMLALPPLVPMLASLVPLKILLVETDIPVNWLPLPIK